MNKNKTGVLLLLILSAALATGFMFSPLSGGQEAQQRECEQACTKTYNECSKAPNADQAACKAALNDCLASCKTMTPKPSPSAEASPSPEPSPSPTMQ